jgi:hypothetical protein
MEKGSSVRSGRLCNQFVSEPSSKPEEVNGYDLPAEGLLPSPSLGIKRSGNSLLWGAFDSGVLQPNQALADEPSR